jgi:small-conductance mechanosensitive channel
MTLRCSRRGGLSIPGPGILTVAAFLCLAAWSKAPAADVPAAPPADVPAAPPADAPPGRAVSGATAPVEDPRGAGAPVRLRGVDLFVIREPLGSVSPAERAELANRKLAAALRDPAIGPEHVITAAEGGMVVIQAGPLRLLEVAPADAAAHDSTPTVLADLWAGLIRAELDRQKREAFSLLLVGRWLARMLYPAAILLLVWLGSLLLDRLAERLAQRPTERLPTLNVLGITLLGPLAVRRVLQRLIGLGRAVLYLALAYAFLGIVFAQFPRTRVYAWDMLVFVTGALGAGLRRLLDWLPPLVAVVILFLAARLAVKLNALLFARARAGRAVLPAGLGRDNLAVTEALLRGLIVLAALVLTAIVLPGEGGQAMLAVLFLALLIAAVSLVPPARQAAAGVLLAYIRAAPVGARIDVEGTRGTVQRRDLLHTVLRTDDGHEVWLPHSHLLGRRVTQLAPPSE